MSMLEKNNSKAFEGRGREKSNWLALVRMLARDRDAAMLSGALDAFVS